MRNTNARDSKNESLTTCNSLMWLLPDMCSEALNFLKDHLPHLRHILNDLKRKIEGARAVWLIRSIVPNVKIAML